MGNALALQLSIKLKRTQVCSGTKVLAVAAALLWPPLQVPLPVPEPVLVQLPHPVPVHVVVPEQCLAYFNKFSNSGPRSKTT